MYYGVLNLKKKLFLAGEEMVSPRASQFLEKTKNSAGSVSLISKLISS